MTEKKKSFLRYLAVPTVLIVGIAIMMLLVASKKAPPKTKQSFPGILVRTMTAEVKTQPFYVEGYGTVKPKYQVSLTPQVGGKIEWVHPELITGGVFTKGDVLVRIEQDDYELAVEQAQAQVANAEYSYAIAQANAEIARNEWNSLKEVQGKLGFSGSSLKGSPDALVLHEPQIKQAQANLASAKAALKAAELRLQRTEITAPFNGRVISESASPGQIVNMGVSLATIYATDVYEIEIGLAMDDLMMIPVPGAQAVVKLKINNQTLEWGGSVNRISGHVDERKRLQKALIVIENPEEQNEINGVDLPVNSYVKVVIEGNPISDVIVVPRHVVHDDSLVWVLSPKSTLDIRKITAARVMPEQLYLADGIRNGEKIITSNITGAAQGLKLRVAGQKGSQVAQRGGNTK